jgi:hypothetical protein
MKKMILILWLSGGWYAHAQTVPLTQAFSVGIELNAPSSSTYIIGVGVSGKFEIPVAATVGLTVTAGYNALFRENQFFDYGGGEARVLSFLPLKVGGRYHFKNNIYAEVETGTAIRIDPDSRAFFAVSAGAGYILKLRAGNALDFGLRGESWPSQINMLAVKVAYRFN